MEAARNVRTDAVYHRDSDSPWNTTGQAAVAVLIISLPLQPSRNPCGVSASWAWSSVLAGPWLVNIQISHISDRSLKMGSGALILALTRPS